MQQREQSANNRSALSAGEKQILSSVIASPLVDTPPRPVPSTNGPDGNLPTHAISRIKLYCLFLPFPLLLSRTVSFRNFGAGCFSERRSNHLSHGSGPLTWIAERERGRQYVGFVAVCPRGRGFIQWRQDPLPCACVGDRRRLLRLSGRLWPLLQCTFV